MAELIDKLTEKEVFGLIAEGMTQRQIAEHFGMSLGNYQHWMRSDISRSTRARAAYEYAATTYADQALDELRLANDPLELAKARERASHFRWLSAKYDRARFGDKLEVSGDLSVNVQVMAYDVAGKLQVIEDVSTKADKQGLILEHQQGQGGVVSAGAGGVEGNPRSTASHVESHDSSDKPLSKRKQAKIERKRNHMNVSKGPGGSVDMQDVMEKDTK